MAGNTETHPRLALIVIGALAQGMPERAMAAESGTGGNFVFGGHHPDYDEYFACYDLISGGWGGRDYADGNDCVIAIYGNCRFNPVEVFETRFPFHVEDFAMTPDSGGPGRHRGGLGYRKTLRTLSAEITASQCTDRHRIKAWGLFGGKEGAVGATLVRLEGADDWRPVTETHGKVSSSKYANIRLRPGDRVRLIVPGAAATASPVSVRRKRWRKTWRRATSRPRPRAATTVTPAERPRNRPARHPPAVEEPLPRVRLRSGMFRPQSDRP